MFRSTAVQAIALTLGTLVAPVTRLTTDHLQISTALTEPRVSPGTPFAIVLDIKPRSGMHVYAPGAKGYKIIRLTLEANPLLVAGPLQYPPSQAYRFEPLNEQVPVYQQPFRLTQPLTISAAPQHRAALAATGMLAIRGKLDYQACDDRLCFAPKSVPVSYTVAVQRTER